MLNTPLRPHHEAMSARSNKCSSTSSNSGNLNTNTRTHIGSRNDRAYRINTSIIRHTTAPSSSSSSKPVVPPRTGSPASQRTLVRSAVPRNATPTGTRNSDRTLNTTTITISIPLCDLGHSSRLTLSPNLIPNLNP